MAAAHDGVAQWWAPGLGCWCTCLANAATNPNPHSSAPCLLQPETGRRLLAWAKQGDARSMSSLLEAGAPFPTYGMFSVQGDAAVDGILAHALSEGLSWADVEKQLYILAHLGGFPRRLTRLCSRLPSSMAALLRRVATCLEIAS